MTLSRRHPLGVLVVIGQASLLPHPSACSHRRSRRSTSPTMKRLRVMRCRQTRSARRLCFQILIGPPPGAGRRRKRCVRDRRVSASRQLNYSRSTSAPVQRRRGTPSRPVLLSGSVQTRNGGELANGPAARAAFGAPASHATGPLRPLQLGRRRHRRSATLDRIAPPIFPTCNPADFPLIYTPDTTTSTSRTQFPLEGCPPGGPRPDSRSATASEQGRPTTPRGGQPVPGTDMNVYDLAAKLATPASTDLYTVARLVADERRDAANTLFQTGGPQPGSCQHSPTCTREGRTNCGAVDYEHVTVISKGLITIPLRMRVPVM